GPCNGPPGPGVSVDMALHRTWLRAGSRIVTALALAGCGDEPGTGREPADDGTIEKEAAGYASLEKSNAKPFVSKGHQAGQDVNVWVNATGAETYRSLATAPRGVTFPEGSLIVKEMLMPGADPILTVLYKMPKGYDASAADWWRGRLGADGKPLSDDSVGKIGFCAQCHMAADSTDDVFGLPD